MTNLNRVCVGIDVTAPPSAAIATAAVLARTYGASIELVAVIEPRPVYTFVLPTDEGQADVRQATAKAEEMLGEIATTIDGVEVVCAVRVGAPFVELIAAARDQAELLVVGSSLSEHSLVGSTAERVVRKAGLPVLVAKRALATMPTTILAPTDFSPASMPALLQAVTLARQWGARLLMAHIIEPVAQVYGWAAELAGSDVFCVEPEALEPEWRALLGQLDLSNIRWEQITLKGRGAQTLIDLAASREVDLIVIGTHGRSALPHALLGSIAEAVVRGAQGCVLSVRHDAFTFRLP